MWEVQPPISSKHLEQLAEDLRCKHQLASNQLKRFLDEVAEVSLLREAYKECMQTKLQWNLAVRILERLGAEGLKWGGKEKKSWSDCSTDQLKVTADIILGTLIRTSRYMALAEKVERTPSLASTLDLEAAASLFKQLCVQGTARYIETN